MSSKAYALSLLAVAIALFAIVVGFNLTLDPQKIYRGGALDHSPSTNDRFLRFQEYEAHAQDYDGLVFGSSRGYVVPLDLLSRETGGVRYANFSVYGGMLSDHLLVTEHLLPQRAARGHGFRSIFLLLDPDKLGEIPLTNRILQYTWPPAVTGENPARFWWRNLTAIQPEAWRDRLRRRRQQTPAATAQIAPASSSRLLASIALAGASKPEPASAAPAPIALPNRILQRPTQRPYFSEQMSALQRIADLCREYKVNLFIAVSPLHPSNLARFDLADLDRAVQRASSHAPLWDFHDSPALADREELWLDTSHFSPQAVAMMLDCMFSESPSAGERPLCVRRGF